MSAETKKETMFACFLLSIRFHSHCWPFFCCCCCSNWHFILFDSFYFVIVNVISSIECVEPNVLCTMYCLRNIHIHIYVCTGMFGYILFICIFLRFWFKQKYLSLFFFIWDQPVWQNIRNILQRTEEGHNASLFLNWPLQMLCGQHICAQHFPTDHFVPSNIETFPSGQTFNAK